MGWMQEPPQICLLIYNTYLSGACLIDGYLLELALLGKLFQQESGKNVCKVYQGMAKALLISRMRALYGGYL
jgi:hypothetical protein